MKIQIRSSVFETNSSSTHSISIVPKDQYEKFKNGELYWGDCELLTYDEVIEQIKKYDPDFDITDSDAIDEYMRDNSILSFDEFENNCYLETFTTNYTTKSGDEIVAFGWYGNDN